MSSEPPGRLSSQRVMWRSSDHTCLTASTWVSSATLLSSASICAHSWRASRISRAAVYALAIASGPLPVSSCMRIMKVAPMRLSVELVTAVAMISRFSRWRCMCSAYFSCSGAGK